MTVMDPVVFFLLTCDKSTVTLTQVVEGTGLERKPVLRVLDKLAGEGFLIETVDKKEAKGFAEPGPARQNPTWKIVRELTERPAKRPGRNTGRDKIWRAIRQLKRGFTRSDLVRLSGSARASVEEYTKLLERDGHLKVVGKTGRQLRYNMASESLKRPIVSEKTAKINGGGDMFAQGWLEILRQRADVVGMAEVAREMGVSSATISLLLSGKYPANTENMERRVMKMYGANGKVVCPVLGEIAPAKCAELWNRARKLGVKGGNPRVIKQHKACLNCDLRKG